MIKPTNDNTVEEIKAYLDANNVPYTSTMLKADLLALVDTVPDEPAQAPAEEQEPETAPEPVPEPIVEQWNTNWLSDPQLNIYYVPQTSNWYFAKFTKTQLIYYQNFPGKIRDLLKISLKSTQTYTINEAMDAIEYTKGHMF